MMMMVVVVVVVIISWVDDSVLTIAIGVYVVGFMVNGFVSGSLYKQAFFPRTSPGWQSVMVKSCFTIPGMV